MTIGELARRVALNPKTIRYYEEIGLLPRPRRTASGYRQYDEEAVSTLGFVQRAKLLGLTLEDVREILALHERGEQPCGRVLALIDAQLEDIEQRIRELTNLRADMTALRGQWADTASQRPDATCLCPIIEEQTAVAKRPARDRTPEPARRQGRATAVG